MCSSLMVQVRSIAVAWGDLTQKIEIQVEGEMLTLKGKSMYHFPSLDVDIE
jgi:osomolarity two-component system sensor histidine kinase NIK1